MCDRSRMHTQQLTLNGTTAWILAHIDEGIALNVHVAQD